MNDLETLKNRFVTHSNKHIDLNALDEFGFKSLLWALDTGRFELTGNSEKDFIRWIYTGTERAFDILNSPITKQQFIEALQKTSLP